MALWGNSDNVTSAGTVGLNYSTKVVTGSSTKFGDAGSAQVGDVIRFGYKFGGGTFFGDAAIVSIASTVSCTIASTDGLSGAAIAATSFTVSQLPQYTTLDSEWSDNTGIGGTADNYVYGIGKTGVEDASGGQYETGAGWVGVTTYMDNHGNFRVKKEILVAMSGIQTGNIPVYDSNPNA